MFNKRLLALVVLASIASQPLVQANELAPVIEQQTNLLPPAEPITAAPTAIRSGRTNPTDTRWYIAPYGTFLNTAGDRSNAENGGGGGLAIGKMIDQHFNVEVKGFMESADGYNDWRNPNAVPQPFGSRHRGSWDFAGATADLQYYLFRDKFSPYGVVAIGGMNTSVPGRSTAGFIGEIGAGFTYEVLDNLSLRTDLRYRYNQNFGTQLTTGGTDQFNDMTANVGLVIPLGAKPQAEIFTPPPAPVHAPMPVRAPMPAPVPVPLPPPPIHHVADCSTLDADIDGVNNCLDRCPETLRGSRVNKQGCPVALELKGVNFQLNSFVLTLNAKTILNAVAHNLIEHPLKDTIQVNGHTCDEGTAAHNMTLSQQRAQAVATYLTSKGVRNHLIIKGFGKTKPLVPNNSEPHRQQNRRVELIWMGH
jgi:OOP family OmpA-OmpF porin